MKRQKRRLPAGRSLPKARRRRKGTGCGHGPPRFAAARRASATHAGKRRGRREGERGREGKAAGCALLLRPTFMPSSENLKGVLGLFSGVLRC